MNTKHSGRVEALKNAIVAALNGTGLKGAGEVNSTALKTVRKAFTKSIHGVMVVAKEPEPAWLSNNWMDGSLPAGEWMRQPDAIIVVLNKKD